MVKIKIIYLKDYHNNGVYIDLERSLISVFEYTLNHEKYFSRDKKYYIHCKRGIKSKRLVSFLDSYGYDVTQVL